MNPSEYTYLNHLYLTIVGIVLLVILLFTLRAEMTFLAQSKEHRLQFVLSLLSLFIMFLLTLTTLFHWVVRPVTAFTLIMALLPLLLILAPLILLLRARAFARLAKSRMEEQKALMREVQDLIDEKKREKIRAAKLARGEKTDPGSES